MPAEPYTMESTINCLDLEQWTQEQEKLALAAALRDPSAFTPLYRHYVDPVYRYLFSRVGNQQDAQDLTSQVFLAALEGLANYRDDGHFAAWLFGIARHKAMDHFRRRRPDLPLDAFFDPPDFPDPLGTIIREEEKARLRSLVRELHENDQELLRLRFNAGLSFAEIAVLLNRTQEAVKKNLYRLIDRLAKKYSPN